MQHWRIWCIVGCLWLSGCRFGAKDLSRFTALEAAGQGIGFQNQLSYDESYNVYLFKSFYNGAGVGMGDFDKDGRVDLFFCGNQVGNKLYLNRGEFRFSDATDAAGLGGDHNWSTGVSVVDINADGWLDLYVCKSGRPGGKNRQNELFINTGLNKDNVPVFVERAHDYGLADESFAVHAVFFDYDRDNDLDVYLLTNSTRTSSVIYEAREDLRTIRDVGGNKLYRNDDGHFTDVSEQAGIYGSAIGFGLGVAVGDVNQDGWPDIYVANDFFEKDYLYLNQQNGTFREQLDQTTNELSLGAMGVDMADINNDGLLDIFVTEMLPRDQRRLKTKTVFDSWEVYKLKQKNGYARQFPRNTLQLNQGITGPRLPAFSELSRYAGVSSTDWSWGVLMTDLDNDGHKEIVVTNGLVKDLIDQDYIDFYTDPERVRSIYAQKGAVIKELVDGIPSEPIANAVFKQTKDLRFTDVAEAWGLATPGFSTGVAVGDLDNDGDQDLVINNLNAPPSLLRNNTQDKADGTYLTVSLVGIGSNRQGLGATIRLQCGPDTYFQELQPMRGTMSSVDSRLHFGLGNHLVVDTLDIRWPDGTRTVQTNVPANQFITIAQATGQPVVSLAQSTGPATWLTDVSERIPIPFRHVENDFVEFVDSPFVPYSMANQGPTVAVGDVNRDGLPDLYMGGSAGKPGKLLLQTIGGRYVSKSQPAFLADSASEDTDAVFFDGDNDGDLDLYVASGGYEFSPNAFALADRLYLNDGTGKFRRSPQVLPGTTLENSTVVLACDYDRDGDQDLFVGTGSKPMQYGVDAASYLLQNDGKGNFTDVTDVKAPALRQAGHVTDALWLDYDRDGDDDLVVVGYWMPIRLFTNQGGRLIDETMVHNLGKTNGFWNVLAQADLDGDGDQDLAVGNLGLNTLLKATDQTPVQMYVKDFDRNGRVEQLITVYDGDNAYPLATKKELTAQLPHLKYKYIKHASYAEQQIMDIFTADELTDAVVKTVTTTATSIFWNQQGRFEQQTLPWQAQLSPVYSLLIDDLNHDGQPELVLGGNQYRAKPQLGIYGASCGLVATVSPQRTVRIVPLHTSGFLVTGQVRSLNKLTNATGTYLLVARNDDTPRMFRYRSTSYATH